MVRFLAEAREEEQGVTVHGFLPEPLLDALRAGGGIAGFEFEEGAGAGQARKERFLGPFREKASR